MPWQQKGLFLKKVSIFQEFLISDGIYPNVEEDLFGNQSSTAEDMEVRCNFVNLKPETPCFKFVLDNLLTFELFFLVFGSCSTQLS